MHFSCSLFSFSRFWHCLVSSRFCLVVSFKDSQTCCRAFFNSVISASYSCLSVSCLVRCLRNEEIASVWFSYKCDSKVSILTLRGLLEESEFDCRSQFMSLNGYLQNKYVTHQMEWVRCWEYCLHTSNCCMIHPIVVCNSFCIFLITIKVSTTFKKKIVLTPVFSF